MAAGVIAGAAARAGGGWFWPKVEIVAPCAAFAKGLSELGAKPNPEPGLMRPLPPPDPNADDVPA